MAKMKRQIKTPEKELSHKEIAEFKTLVIKILTETVEYGCKKRGRSEGYAK